MAQVIIENLVKTFTDKSGKDVTAVKGINLVVHDREFMVLVGPSGSGKSTTLRMIASLEDITAGTIRIGERVVNDVLPKDRDIAMVFQNYALYPHMNVFENLAFGLKLQKLPAAEIDQRVKEAALLLGLEGLLERRPKALSGGQRQRVAVGRAIVRKPKVFLFDEPLSNLDAKMRGSTRMEISRLHRRLKATMIYVTHDQVEAMTMGDRNCVMKDGRILQLDDPLTLYARPSPWRCPPRWPRRRLPSPGAMSCSASGRRIFPRPPATTPRPFPRAWNSASPWGRRLTVHLRTATSALVARLPPGADFPLARVAQVHLNLDRLHLFDAVTENAIR